MLKLQKNTATIILAAGMGTRMKSDKAKVLHEISKKPMILYVVEIAQKITGDNIIIVVGNQAENVKKTVSKISKATFAMQKQQLGTGHAVLCALPYLPDYIEQTLILCGDVPLITYDTINNFVDEHIKAQRDISILAVEVDNPKGYGRIVLDKNKHVSKIVEDADATQEQAKIKIINTGIYCVTKDFLLKFLEKIQQNNAQGEFYLTDIIEIGNMAEKNIGITVAKNYDDFIGVNSAHDLAIVEKIMRKRT